MDFFGHYIEGLPFTCVFLYQKPFQTVQTYIIHNPPPKTYPLRNKGLIAGLIKGNQQFNKALIRAAFLMGVRWLGGVV